MLLTHTSICLDVIIDFLASTSRSGADGYALYSKYFSSRGVYSYKRVGKVSDTKVTEGCTYMIEERFLSVCTREPRFCDISGTRDGRFSPQGGLLGMNCGPDFIYGTKFIGRNEAFI